MRKACAATVVLMVAVSGCGGSGGSGQTAASVCKDMLDELTSLQAVSANIQAQEYATPAEAVTAISEVGTRMTATNRDATSTKANDVSVSFGLMLIAVQDFQANIASQDATKESQVQTELAQGDAAVRAACAKH